MKSTKGNLELTAKKLQNNQLIESLQADRIKGGLHTDPPPFLSDKH